MSPFSSGLRDETYLHNKGIFVLISIAGLVWSRKKKRQQKNGEDVSKIPEETKGEKSGVHGASHSSHNSRHSGEVARSRSRSASRSNSSPHSSVESNNDRRREGISEPKAQDNAGGGGSGKADQN